MNAPQPIAAPPRSANTGALIDLVIANLPRKSRLRVQAIQSHFAAYKELSRIGVPQIKRVMDDVKAHQDRVSDPTTIRSFNETTREIAADVAVAMGAAVQQWIANPSLGEPKEAPRVALAPARPIFARTPSSPSSLQPPKGWMNQAAACAAAGISPQEFAVTWKELTKSAKTQQPGKDRMIHANFRGTPVQMFLQGNFDDWYVAPSVVAELLAPACRAAAKESPAAALPAWCRTNKVPPDGWLHQGGVSEALHCGPPRLSPLWKQLGALAQNAQPDAQGIVEVPLAGQTLRIYFGGPRRPTCYIDPASVSLIEQALREAPKKTPPKVKTVVLAPVAPEGYRSFAQAAETLSTSVSRLKPIWREMETLAKQQMHDRDHRVRINFRGFPVTLFCGERNRWYVSPEGLEGPLRQAVEATRKKRVARERPAKKEKILPPEGYLVLKKAAEALKVDYRDLRPLWHALIAAAELQPRDAQGMVEIDFHGTPVKMCFGGTMRPTWNVDPQAVATVVAEQLPNYRKLAPPKKASPSRERQYPHVPDDYLGINGARVALKANIALLRPIWQQLTSAADKLERNAEGKVEVAYRGENVTMAFGNRGKGRPFWYATPQAVDGIIAQAYAEAHAAVPARQPKVKAPRPQKMSYGASPKGWSQSLTTLERSIARLREVVEQLNAAADAAEPAADGSVVIAYGSQRVTMRRAAAGGKWFAEPEAINGVMAEALTRGYLRPPHPARVAQRGAAHPAQPPEGYLASVKLCDVLHTTPATFRPIWEELTRLAQAQTRDANSMVEIEFRGRPVTMCFAGPKRAYWYVAPSATEVLAEAVRAARGKRGGAGNVRTTASKRQHPLTPEGYLSLAGLCEEMHSTYATMRGPWKELTTLAEKEERDENGRVTVAFHGTKLTLCYSGERRAYWHVEPAATEVFASLLRETRETNAARRPDATEKPKKPEKWLLGGAISRRLCTTRTHSIWAELVAEANLARRDAEGIVKLQRGKLSVRMQFDPIAAQWRAEPQSIIKLMQQELSVPVITASHVAAASVKSKPNGKVNGGEVLHTGKGLDRNKIRGILTKAMPDHVAAIPAAARFDLITVIDDALRPLKDLIPVAQLDTLYDRTALALADFRAQGSIGMADLNTVLSNRQRLKEQSGPLGEQARNDSAVDDVLRYARARLAALTPLVPTGMRNLIGPTNESLSRAG